jgi:hypothetical protein
MLDHIVMAINTDMGYYSAISRRQVLGVTIPEDACIDYHNHAFGDGDEDPFEFYKVWACEEPSAGEVATKLARNNPGKEVKVFKLTEIHVAPPGDVVKKLVTKEGILPF